MGISRHSPSHTISGRRAADGHFPVLARLPAKPLVLCGAVAFLFYVAMDIVASLRYDGYSVRDQTISELSAIDAPTRSLWLALSVVYQLLIFAFALGTLRAAGHRQRVRIVGWLLVASAAVGVLWWVAPMHRREVLAADGGTWQDTMHLALGGVSSVLFFATIGAGAFMFGRLFRLYSLTTIGLLIAFGWLTSTMASKVGNNEPTPWLGIWERIAVEGAMLWQAIFAILLAASLRRSTSDSDRN